MYDSVQKKYVCVECNKKYKTIGGIRRHLKTQHEWAFAEEDGFGKSTTDHIALYRASFMKCALLLRDTSDAYKMGDGNRVTCNAKFQMLLSRVGNHTKYQLWLFRYLAYCHCLLTPRMAYEYKWNCSANVLGGIGHNIPNDNLVEILVQMVKKKVYAQGANATFESVKKAALTLQIQEEIKENIQNECKKQTVGKKRPVANKLKDVTSMALELTSAKVFDYVPGREYNSFKSFSDVFSCIKVTELHKWITENRDRLSYEAV